MITRGKSHLSGVSIPARSEGWHLALDERERPEIEPGTERGLGSAYTSSARVSPNASLNALSVTEV
jgi:hypothetical protein